MTTLSLRCWTMAAMAALTVMARSQESAGSSTETRVRSAAAKAAQQVVQETKGSLPAQIVLVVEEGLHQREIEAGFLEVLVHSGITPQLERGTGEARGSLLVRCFEDPDGMYSFEVRIESGGEKIVSYAKLIHVAPDDSSAWERLLVPVVLVASTVMVVYLLFTVRS